MVKLAPEMALASRTENSGTCCRMKTQLSWTAVLGLDCALVLESSCHSQNGSKLKEAPHDVLAMVLRISIGVTNRPALGPIANRFAE